MHQCCARLPTIHPEVSVIRARLQTESPRGQGINSSRSSPSLGRLGLIGEYAAALLPLRWDNSEV